MLICLTKFTQKGHLRWKTEKLNITVKFCIFELVYVSSFSLNWQFWFFGPNLHRKSTSGLKQKSEHYHWILHIQIRLVTKFQLKLTTNFLVQICPKRVFPVENRKSEHHNWILRIWISLSTKFQLGGFFRGLFFG